MAESWTDKTVSMENVEKEEFDGELAHVTVSENGITVEFKQEKDWKRIQREVGDDTILRQARWEDVDAVDTTTEHLYYPHIDVETGKGERRLYFREDEEELLERCRNAIQRFWNASRGSGTGSQTSYSYDAGDGEETESGGETEEEVEIGGDTGTEDAERGEEEPSEEEKGGNAETKDSVEDVVEEFIDS